MFVCASRHFSAGVVIISKPSWRITSVKEGSCSPSPAPQWLLYTTFPMKYLSTSCITSTPMARRLVHNFCLKLFCSVVCEDANMSFGYKIKSSCLLVSKPRSRKKDIETEASPSRTSLWLTDWFPTVRHEPVKKKNVCVGTAVLLLLYSTLGIYCIYTVKLDAAAININISIIL